MLKVTRATKAYNKNFSDEAKATFQCLECCASCSLTFDKSKLSKVVLFSVYINNLRCSVVILNCRDCFNKYKKINDESVFKRRTSKLLKSLLPYSENFKNELIEAVESFRKPK